MTKTSLLINQLKNISKSYFTLADLKKFYKDRGRNLPVIVNRLVKQKKLIRLRKNYYTTNLSQIDWESLAIEILSPAYLSFEYALWKHGLINEIPARLTLATTKKSRTFVMPNNVFEYSHLNKILFFGYKLEGSSLMALPEKAYLDELYLISLRKRSLNLKSIDTKKLKKNLIKKWLKKYPIYTQRLVRKVLNI